MKAWASQNGNLGEEDLCTSNTKEISKFWVWSSLVKKKGKKYRLFIDNGESSFEPLDATGCVTDLNEFCNWCIGRQIYQMIDVWYRRTCRSMDVKWNPSLRHSVAFDTMGNFVVVTMSWEEKGNLRWTVKNVNSIKIGDVNSENWEMWIYRRSSWIRWSELTWTAWWKRPFLAHGHLPDWGIQPDGNWWLTIDIDDLEILGGCKSISLYVSNLMNVCSCTFLLFQDKSFFFGSLKCTWEKAWASMIWLTVLWSFQVNFICK